MRPAEINIPHSHSYFHELAVDANGHLVQSLPGTCTSSFTVRDCTEYHLNTRIALDYYDSAVGFIQLRVSPLERQWSTSSALEAWPVFCTSSDIVQRTR